MIPSMGRPRTGHVRRRGSDGRWEARVTVGYVAGRQVRRSFYGRTRAEAAEKLRKALAELEVGLDLGDARVTLAAYLTDWLQAAKPTVRPSTFRRYRQIVQHHIVPAIGGLRLIRLGPRDVERMLRQAMEGTTQAAAVSPRTAHHIRAVLRTSLSRAVRHGMLARNAAALADAPAVPRSERPVLSPPQVRALLEAARGDRLEALYVMAVGTGLRQGELLGLRWADIDLERRAVTVRRALQRIDGLPRLVETKTRQSRRTLGLPSSLVAALRAHRLRQAQEQWRAGDAWVDDGLVFATSIGTPLFANHLSSALARLLTRAGLPRVRFHDLRHTAASLLLAQGVAPRVVMEQLGHSQIRLTMETYTHVLPPMLRDAADKMDELLGVGEGV